MTTDGFDEVDTFSALSQARLRLAAEEFTGAIQRHTDGILPLPGGSRTLGTVFDLNVKLKKFAAAWEMAVCDHTGTFPLGVEMDEDEDEDDPEDYRNVFFDNSNHAIVVISRWDLAITDTSELVFAGRSAHRQEQTNDTESDAAAAIGDEAVEHALYAIVHKFGEPWFDLPGVEVLSGRRVYMRMEAVAANTSQRGGLQVDGPDTYNAVPVVPDGEVFFSESW